MPVATLGIAASAIPLQITVIPTAGLLFWYDADDASTFILSGANVSQWRDKSGSSRHLGTNAGNATRSVGTIKAGRGSVDFAGAASLSIANGTCNQKPFSLFGVVRHQGTASYRAVVGCVSNNGLELRLTNAHKMSIMKQYVSEIGQGTAVYPTNTACVFGVTYSATGVWAARLNSAADGGGTNDVAFNSPNSYLQVGDALGEALTGNVGELMKYDRVISGPEITQIESYLTTKWK